MYEAVDVAKYVIEYEDSKGRSVSNLRLQKLLYFIQALFIRTRNEPCFLDRMEAWDFGPVIPAVYHEFKLFGSSNIPVSFSKDRCDIAENDQFLINRTLERCSTLSTPALVSRSHSQKPWRDAYHRPFNNVITLQAMREAFGRYSS